MSDKALLDIRGLSVRFATRHGAFTAVDGIDLAVERNEVVEIIQSELGPQPARKLATLMENSLVLDGYSKQRTRYYSARRLFRQIQDIQSDPRWAGPTPADTEKGSAA